MTDDNRKQEDMLKRVTRRYMLRNSAIAATGIVLLPSFITSCKKDDVTNVGGVGDDPLTPGQLQQAAENLRRLRVWVADLYPLTIEYENVVFHALAATKQTGGWTNFIVDVFIDVATILLASAAAATGPAGFAGAVPAIAGLSAFLHDWGIGKDKPTNLDDVFSDFEFGHNVMQFTMEQKLSHLVDPANNYVNLRNEWNDTFEFQNKTYTIGQLASSNFPDLGDDYNTLQTAAFTKFKKLLWNLVIMKCCTYSNDSNWTIDIYNDQSDPTYPYHSVTEYAQQVMYPDPAPPTNKGAYLRARLETRYDEYSTYQLQSWYLGINGNPFPDEACNILFMDDTPTHTINPDGLFNRSYVFEQFALTKPLFILGGGPYGPVWHELGHDPKSNFWQEDDWDFEGGEFKKLTH